MKKSSTRGNPTPTLKVKFYPSLNHKKKWIRWIILKGFFFNGVSLQSHFLLIFPLREGKKIAEKKWKKVKDCFTDREPEFVVKMDENYPPSLRRLWIWESEALNDERTCSFQLCEEAFGSNKKQVLFLLDVHSLCFGGEIPGAIICMYIQ